MKNVNEEPNVYKNIWALILMLFALFCFVFLTKIGRVDLPVSSKVVSIALFPFQGGVSFAVSEISEATTFITDLTTAYEQNEELKREVEQLRKENLEASEYAAENERLRALLGYKQSKTQFDLVPARVIGRENATWTSMIVIDKGIADGVKDLMPVVTDKGLVGHVLEAGAISSKVQLILDPRSSVGAIVQRPESRVMGIVEGDIANSQMPKMVNIPMVADVIEGDMIITSGFGGVYPKGIIVGTVEELKNAPGGLLKYAVVNTSVDFQRLEEVAVIVASREPPPAPLLKPNEQVKAGAP